MDKDKSINIIKDKLEEISFTKKEQENIISSFNQIYDAVWTYKGIDSSFRKAKGLTVRKCIDKYQLNKTEASMSAYENGKREVPASLLISLANNLNVSTDALLKRGVGFLNDKYDNKIKRYVYKNYDVNFTDYKDSNYVDVHRKETQKYYHLNEGVEKSIALIAIELQQEILTLNAPKGSILIVDRSFDVINKDLDHTITCLLKGDDGLYITKVGPVYRYPETKHSDKLLNSYTYFHFTTQDGDVLISKMKELEKLFIGQVKKVIIDLENISGNY